MIKKALATLTILFTLIGGVAAAMSFFATDEELSLVKEDLDLVANRLDLKILDDDIMATRKRVWQIEDRYSDRPNCQWDQDDRNEHRELLEEIKKKEEKRKGLI